MQDDPILAHLNTLQELDRDAMTALVSTKIPCNLRLARYLFGGTYGNPPEVGLLSILNGMIPGPVMLMVYDSGRGGKFQRFRASEDLPPTWRRPEVSAGPHDLVDALLARVAKALGEIQEAAQETLERLGENGGGE